MIETQRQLEEDTPKNAWDATRQTSLWYLIEAEKQIAAVRANLMEHPHDKEPDPNKLMLKIIEKARLARRACNEVDLALSNYWAGKVGTRYDEDESST